MIMINQFILKIKILISKKPINNISFYLKIKDSKIKMKLCQDQLIIISKNLFIEKNLEIAYLCLKA